MFSFAKKFVKFKLIFKLFDTSLKFSETIIIKNKINPKYTNKAEKLINDLFLYCPLLNNQYWIIKVNINENPSIISMPIKNDKKRSNSVYSGLNPLVGDDIAKVISYVVNCPQNVNISDITVLAKSQASSTVLNRK